MKKIQISIIVIACLLIVYIFQASFSNLFATKTNTKTDVCSGATIPLDFIATNLEICQGDSTIFLTQNFGTEYLWNFGEGAIPKSANTFGPHIVFYETSGLKNISLTLDGYTVEKQEYIIVQYPPETSFEYSTAGQMVTFNNSTPEATSFEWDFGDGQNSTEINPSHFYSSTGFYNVCLTAELNNCDSTFYQTIAVGVPPPASNFSYTINNLTVNFSNNSTGAASYFWTFGDGTSSTDENPIHSYTTIGNYNVELTITNGTLSDTYTETIVIQNNSTVSNKIAGFEIFPNPAQNSINISLPVNLNNLVLKIYDSTGNLLNTEKIIPTEKTKCIDLQDFANGIYIIELLGNNFIATEHFVVSK